MKKPKIEDWQYDGIHVELANGRFMPQKKIIESYSDMIDALINMKQFVENGVEFGYICLPEEGDSALDAIAKIDKALIKAGCTDA